MHYQYSRRSLRYIEQHQGEKMPIITHLGGKSIDLMTIKTGGDFLKLNRYSQKIRQVAAKKMITELSDQDIMQVIIKLTPLCFDTKGKMFIRGGTSDFLADVILAYVKKHDGSRLAKTFNRDNISSLTDFKFSKQSVEVFTTLQVYANVYSHEKKDPQYSQYLPFNVANKILQPIIYKLQSVGKFVKDSALATAIHTMAANEPLVTEIFKKNTTVTPFTISEIKHHKTPETASASQPADHDESPPLPPKQYGKEYYLQLIKSSNISVQNQAPKPTVEPLASQKPAIKNKFVATQTSTKTPGFFPLETIPEKTIYLTIEEMQKIQREEAAKQKEEKKHSSRPLPTPRPT